MGSGTLQARIEALLGDLSQYDVMNNRGKYAKLRDRSLTILSEVSDMLRGAEPLPDVAPEIASVPVEYRQRIELKAGSEISFQHGPMLFIVRGVK